MQQRSKWDANFRALSWLGLVPLNSFRIRWWRDYRGNWSKYLCLGGRIALIKSAFPSLVYYIYLSSGAWCLVNCIERVQRDFLWRGKGVKKKFHLVDWASLCRPKTDGGLGFKSVKHMNQALWQMAEENPRRPRLFMVYSHCGQIWGVRKRVGY